MGTNRGEDEQTVSENTSLPSTTVVGSEARAQPHGVQGARVYHRGWNTKHFS